MKPPPIIDEHFEYLEKIKSLYHQRKDNPVALQKCIEVCIKDIELFPDYAQWFKNDFQIRNGKAGLPLIPSFKQLAIIYEKAGLFKEAIEVCDLALQYKIEEDYEKRKQRLQKKRQSIQDN